MTSMFLQAEDRRKSIISIVVEELKEVDHISRTSGGHNPNLYLKKAELLLEKGRLEREIENEAYLSYSPQKRNSVNKKQFFKKSAKSFNEAQRICNLIIRKFPGYEYIGDVYFILAYYSKEQGQTNQALRNFNKARVSTTNKKTMLKSETAMAEIFYSANKCQQAVKLYAHAIPQTNEKWKSKDLYNYGWCLYKLQRYDDAISALRESHRLSAKKNYIDMGSRVESDIVIFYVAANRLQEGLTFIRKKGRHKEVTIEELVLRLKEGGEFTKAERLLEDLIKQTPESSKEKPVYEVMLFKYYGTNDWLKSSKLALKLNNYRQSDKLNDKQLSLVKNKSLTMMSSLQKRTINEKNAIAKKQFALAIAAHGQLALGGTEVEKSKVNLAIAESYSIAKDYRKALKYYLVSHDISKKNNFNKTANISLEGALHAVGKSNDLVGLESVYSRYLASYPVGKKSAVIYEKLFNVHVKSGKLEDSSKVLTRFQSKMPQYRNKEEALLVILLEEYRKKKDYSAIKGWTSKVSSGSFPMSVPYKNKIFQISNSVTEQEASSLIKTGNWNAAIQKYEVAYARNQDKKTKANIALNISQIYDSKLSYEKSLKWLSSSISQMSPLQVKQSEQIINKLALSFFYRGYTSKSQQVTKAAWTKSCGSEKLFQNTMIMTNALALFKTSQSLYVASMKCRLSSKVYQYFGKEILGMMEVESNRSGISQILKVQRQYGVSFPEQAYFYDIIGDNYNRNKSLKRHVGAASSKIQNLKEQSKLLSVTSLEKSITRYNLSSNLNLLPNQVKSLLNNLSKMNASSSKISNKTETYIKSMISLLKAYQSSEVKVKKLILKTKLAAVTNSLKPVLKALTVQKNEIFKKALQSISREKNYSSVNQDLLKFLKVGQKRSTFREGL